MSERLPDASDAVSALATNCQEIGANGACLGAKGIALKGAQRSLLDAEICAAP